MQPSGTATNGDMISDGEKAISCTPVVLANTFLESASSSNASSQACPVHDAGSCCKSFKSRFVRGELVNGMIRKGEGFLRVLNLLAESSSFDSLRALNRGSEELLAVV